jgi:hypothetical protein
VALARPSIACLTSTLTVPSLQIPLIKVTSLSFSLDRLALLIKDEENANQRAYAESNQAVDVTGEANPQNAVASNRVSSKKWSRQKSILRRAFAREVAGWC